MLTCMEECKLMKAFAQINLSQFAVRSPGKRSHLQQEDDSQMSLIFHFLISIVLILFVKFDNGI